MQQKQIVLPLDLSPEDARLTWNGVYYAVSAALCLPGRAESETDVEQLLDASLLVLKLIPFRDKLRTRMLSLLADEGDQGDESKEPAPARSPSGARPAFGVVAEVSLRSGRLGAVQDVRKALPAESAPTGQEFDPNAAQSVELPESDLFALRASLQRYLDTTLLKQLREPFASFVPELVGGPGGWKERPLPGGGRPDALVPYQMVFPDAFPIDIDAGGHAYVLDDLYCTRPGCPCVDVTCIILRQDPASGQSAAHAGFKYNIETGKSKAMSEFPTKLNVAEYFKRFSQGHPIDLDVVLRSRYRFMRGEFIANAKERLALAPGPAPRPLQGLK
jgi:hypothetical protein